MRRATLLTICPFILGLAPVALAETPTPRPSVETRQGVVAGIAADGLESFRGIPYAAAPVGDRRWSAPIPPEAWEGVRDASQYGPRCMQPTGLGFKKASPLPMSEDCLTLNIMRPAGWSGKKLPVMVWIHGGGMVTGTGADPVFNGAAIPKKDVVLVTINYRLGHLGFFAHAALDAAAEGPVAANFGILDQIEALKWLGANISAFGGDEKNITIFGESAGATSVDALMASPLAKGLFSKAIASSANARAASATLDDMRRYDAALVEALGLPAESAADLRAIPAERLMEMPRLDPMSGFAPVVDNVVLKRSIIDSFEAGEQAAVPYLVGSNDLELPKIYQTPDLAGRFQLPTALRSALVKAYGSEAELDLRLLSDIIFSEPARRLATLHASVAPTYRYRFEILSASAPKAFGGASHASELGYVFQTLEEMPWPTAERDWRLAATVTDYWVEFARTGKPGIGGQPAWPKAGGDHIIRFTNGGPVTGADPWKGRLDLLTASYKPAPAFTFGPAATAEVLPKVPASTGMLSVSSPIAALLADERAKAAIEAELPGLSAHPMLSQFKDKSLIELQALAPRILNVEKLAAIEARLKSLAGQ